MIDLRGMAPVPYLNSRESAAEAVALLERRGKETSMFDASVTLTPNEGAGFEVLWELYHLACNNHPPERFSRELQLIGYADQNNQLTKEGREMYTRLHNWYEAESLVDD